MEDTRVLMEMGIDPNTLNPVSTIGEHETTSNIEVEQEAPEEEEVIEESNVIGEPEVETSSSEQSRKQTIPKMKMTIPCSPLIIRYVE